MSDTEQQQQEATTPPHNPAIDVKDDTGSVKTLNEYEEREIPNEEEITSNTATIAAVANYLNLPENEEFSKYYEYTVDYRAISNNFIAKFRLKTQYRESAEDKSVEQIIDFQESVLDDKSAVNQVEPRNDEASKESEKGNYIGRSGISSIQLTPLATKKSPIKLNDQRSEMREAKREDREEAQNLRSTTAETKAGRTLNRQMASSKSYRELNRPITDHAWRSSFAQNRNYELQNSQSQYDTTKIRDYVDDYTDNSRNRCLSRSQSNNEVRNEQAEIENRNYGRSYDHRREGYRERGRNAQKSPLKKSRSNNGRTVVEYQEYKQAQENMKADLTKEYYVPIVEQKVQKVYEVQRAVSRERSRAQFVVQESKLSALYEQHLKTSQENTVIEYEKIETEQQKTEQISSLSLQIRDRIIQTYRQEIDNYNLMNSDFEILKGYIEELRRRKEEYDLSVTILERDYETQVNSQESVIFNLQNELAGLKQDNDEHLEEGQSVTEQRNSITIEIQTYEIELRESNQSSQVIVSDNQSLSKEIENLQQQTNQNLELRQRNQEVIYDKSSTLNRLESEESSSQDRIVTLKNERDSLYEQVNYLNGQSGSSTKQTQEIEVQIASLEDEIAGLKQTIFDLDIGINNYEKSNAFLIDNQKEKLARNSSEFNREHELSAQLQSLEACFYSLDSDEKVSYGDNEALILSNQTLIQRQQDLKAEFEQHQRHCDVLVQQNTELQSELQRFADTDECVKQKLDRLHIVENMKGRVETVVKKSEQILRDRTPTKQKIVEVENQVLMRVESGYSQRMGERSAGRSKIEYRTQYRTSIEREEPCNCACCTCVCEKVLAKEQIISRTSRSRQMSRCDDQRSPVRETSQARRYKLRDNSSPLKHLRDAGNARN